MTASKLPISKPVLMSVNQFCVATCMGRTKAYLLMDKGVIAFLMLGGVRRIPVTEVERLENEAKRAAKQSLLGTA